MESDRLIQKELTELAEQSTISEVLTCKSQINLRKAVVLAKRFGAQMVLLVD